MQHTRTAADFAAIVADTNGVASAVVLHGSHDAHNVHDIVCRGIVVHKGSTPPEWLRRDAAHNRAVRWAELFVPPWHDEALEVETIECVTVHTAHAITWRVVDSYTRTGSLGMPYCIVFALSQSQRMGLR